MTHDPLTQWTLAARQALAADLGVDVPEVDLQVLLDLARDAAHAVDRPAAPVTTYLLGYAAALAATQPAKPGGLADGTAGQDPARAATAVTQGYDVLRRLAAEWDLGLHQS